MKPTRSLPFCVLSVLLASVPLIARASGRAPLQLGDRLELMVDHYLIERLDDTRLVAARPRAEEIVFRFDQPWEEANGMISVLKDGDIYRMYYRAGKPFQPDNPIEITCYAESPDGIHWTRPNLGLHEFEHSKLNNIILPAGDPDRVTHNFAPFLDDRPGVPAGERYKAVGGRNRAFGGVADADEGGARDPRDRGGLHRYVSADGIHWRRVSKTPLFGGYALDTLNVLDWIPAEQVYAVYLRTWSEGGRPDQPVFRGYRTIARSVSKDFVTWSEPELMTFGDTTPDHLYTNGTQPYFRAPHILIALPFRFSPDRQVLSEDELNSFGVRPSQRKGTSDTVFMTSRGGTVYDRTFMESYIRPGLDRRSWHARNVKAAKGVVPTGDGEMSIYVAVHNTLLTSHLVRYTLPLDRFASVSAPYAGGSLLTKPLTFTGRRLVLNYATSAAGSIRVELLDEAGRPLPGFGAADCDEIIGDELERPVSWQGRTDLGELVGRTVRLRFTMMDADLYALRFAPVP